MNGIKPSGVKLDSALLQSFISEVGGGLELSYMEFLKEYNGGVPESNVVHLQDEKVGPVSVTNFFGIGLDPINNLIDVFHTFQGRVPNRFLPIAMVEGGNLICISLNSSDFGKIYFWDHDSELITVESVESVSLVANSFKGFVEKIQFNTDVDVSNYEVEEVWIDENFLKELGKK